MSANSNKELKLLAGAALDFAKKELAPNRENNDRFPFGPFWDPVLEKAFELDFFHTTLPEEFSGIGQGMSALCTVLENISQEDASLAGIIFTNTQAQEIMRIAKSDGLLKKAGNAKTAKEFLIAFPAFNNPSEVEHVASASKSGDGYTVSGGIEYVVLGGMAAQAVIPARLDGQDGYSFFFVDLSADGINRSDPVFSLGFHACPAVDMTFNNVKAALIGEEGRGQEYFEKMADRMSVAAAAISLGIMKGSLKEALDYCTKRFQGGREIIKWSEMKMILGNMAVMTKNAELILSSACRATDAYKNGWEQCCRAAAIHIQEMACDLTTDGIQVLGGVGYMKDFGQEKRFRDAKQAQSLLGMASLKKVQYLESIAG